LAQAFIEIQGAWTIKSLPTTSLPGVIDMKVVKNYDMSQESLCECHYPGPPKENPKGEKQKNLKPS
jgi:hypothetical protein